MHNESNRNLLRSGASLAWRRVKLPFRILVSLSKATLATAVLCLLALNLAMPVLTAASRPVLTWATTVAETVLDVMPPLRSAEAKAAKAETALALKSAEAQTARAAAKRAASAAQEAADAARKLERQVLSLNRQLAETAVQKVIYRAEKRALPEAISDTVSRVNKRLQKSLAADISSMAGEAIPYVGVAVIVGATAYDIDQSCELMKDLHELDVAFNPDHAIDFGEVCGMKAPSAAEVWNSMKSAPGAALDAVANLPGFQWEAGWNDLMGRVPSREELEAAANAATQTITSWWPEFHWQAGWDDLKRMVQP